MSTYVVIERPSRISLAFVQSLARYARTCAARSARPDLLK